MSNIKKKSISIINLKKKCILLTNKNNILKVSQINNYLNSKKKKNVFFFKRLFLFNSLNCAQIPFSLKLLNRKCALKNQKYYVKYLQYFWLKFSNKRVFNFWNFQIYYYFKESTHVFSNLKYKQSINNAQKLFYAKKFLNFKIVSKNNNFCAKKNLMCNKFNIHLLQNFKKIICFKKIKQIKFLPNYFCILYFTKIIKNLKTVLHSLNISTVYTLRSMPRCVGEAAKKQNFLWMSQPFIKNVPAISSVYLANTSLKQIQIFKERFHFGNKSGNNNLNLYINNISAVHNQLKIMQQFLKFRQHLVKVCLFLKLFSTNTLARVAYLYVKKNNSKKIKFKKIKFYNKLLNGMFFKKHKINDFFFVFWKTNKVKNKFQRFKINLKAFKKDLKFINKSFYLNLFFKTNKIFYFNFFVDKYNLNKKKMINTSTKSLCNYSTVFVDTQKKVNIMNFNKFYLLNAGNLLNYKKFNFFFSNPFCKHNTNVVDSISFKQTTLYFRYVIAHLIKKKNSNISKVLVAGQTKTKLNLKKNRKTYLTNVFTFLKLKRFLFFNLTLSFFWKKRSIDFKCSYLLKKYRYFRSLQNKITIKKNNNFTQIIIFFSNLYTNFTKNSVNNTILFYKQASFLFFKYKHYLYLKKQQLITHSFLYRNNYLSWNFLYFWYWYVFAYISIYFQRTVIAVKNLNHIESLSASNIGLSLNAYNKESNIDANILFYLKKETLQNNFKIYFNYYFKIILKYVLLKNSNLYKNVYLLQLNKWKKNFYIFKKIYKNFTTKLQKSQIVSKLKQNTYKKLNLRLKTNITRLNIKNLNFFNTCGYYNYFKRKLFRKKRIYSFFLSFLKKKEKLCKNLQKTPVSIAHKIGIINIVICFNNTYVTLTDLYGNVLFVRSGGLVGIKGPNRSTSVTSEEVTLSVCAFLKKTPLKFLILKFSGVLYSRKIKAAFKVFTFQKNYKILRVFNNTPKAHNGIRLKKKKRL